ncbi:hypothetical protein LPJ64_001163 [Coemansia asiatica]|uniref:Afadin and alpha-actinin-binding-domain-containing protein n=1 Tax=Coemansia asiatica TaxID=1052880 RepID=A0A9W7XP08_9FUNG|nr:hypothetical protein LPJ64_001163 [Coemansia asiatica]
MWNQDLQYGGQRAEEAGTYNNDYDSFDERNDSRMSTGEQQHTYGGIRQMEQTSATSARDHTISSGLNPYTMLHHINRELMESGLPSPLLLPELPEFLEDNRRVVECLLALLEQHKRDSGFRESMSDELRKAMGEEDQLRNTVGRLQRDLDGAQREAAANRIKWQEAERVGGETEGQRKRLAAELRTNRSNAAMVKAQFLHDSKKREQEMVKLKDRLQRLITDKHRASKVSVDLVNPISRDRTGRPMDALGHEREMLRRLIEDYQAKQDCLVERIAGLEDMLRSVNGALSSLHASVCDGQQEDLADGANESSEAPDAGRSLALVESIRSRILRVREQVPAAVDGAELEARDQRIAELEQQVLQLKAEIDELKLILADQKNMLDAATQDVAARAMSMDMSISEMSLEQLEHEREDLRREKQQLEDERKRFTEAAIELGTERAELKREREEFENAKLSKTTSELIAGLPETPQWMKSLDTSMATPMILHQLQAANRGTPTNELLAAMALQNAHAAGAPRSPSANSTISPASAAMETHIEGSDDMDDSFDESAVTPAPKRTSTQQSRSTTGTLYRSTGTLRPQSRTTSATPVRPTPTRTPVDVRSGRQPRVCTRPGCAAHAHAHHEHDDNGGSASPLMELKPPVPRFRRKNDPANGSPPASTVRSRMSHGANRRSGAGSSLAGSGRHQPMARPPTTSAAAAAPPSSRSHAADIFK